MQPLSEGSGLTHYFARIRKHRLLSPERERELVHELRDGSREARDQLIECNLAFVAKIAGDYRHVGVAYEDLLNEGNLGLIEAAHRFDPDRGVRFLTYAAWWIRKAILRALAEHAGLVRLPETQVRLVREYRHVERRLRQKLGRRPRRDEVTEELPADRSRVELVLQAAGRPVSLDQPTRDDGDERPLGQLLVDDGREPADDVLESVEITARVLAAVDKLPATRRAVIRQRFGLDGRAPRTLERIGRRLGVSRERVRQIEAAAVDELRRILRRTTNAALPGRLEEGSSKSRKRRRDSLSPRDTQHAADRCLPTCKEM